MTDKINYMSFLKDVFICSLASYGGPEAHYGVFSSYLVEKKSYITEDELAQMIGLYSLVPGPSSSQTITAIGYHKGGPLLALLTFFVWALPAIVIMTIFGLAFNSLSDNVKWTEAVKFLPAIALAFILFGGINMAKKQLKETKDFVFLLGAFTLGFFFIGKSIWSVPLILIASGLLYLIVEGVEISHSPIKVKTKPWIVFSIISLAIFNELIGKYLLSDLFTVYKSFFRYGYSVIGGGQIVIPLMIQDFVEKLGMVKLNDFMAGYAIDQAIPGPLFSFASFVAARALNPGLLAFTGGIISGLSIFAPGIMLVMFIAPIWEKIKANNNIKKIFKGIGIAASSLILLTAYKQLIGLNLNTSNIIIVGVATVALFSKKIPGPLLVLAGIGLGLLL